MTPLKNPIFYSIINVLTVTFDKLIASLLNKCIKSFKKNARASHMCA